MRSLGLLGAALLAAAAPAPWRLHAYGYGPARAGMSVAAVERALGVRLVFADDSRPADGCWHLKPERGHDEVQFMIQDGRMTRASVWGGDGGVRTLRGAGVGDTEATLKRLYGPELSVEPHAYGGEAARYLTWWTRDRTHGVRFETGDDGRVEAIHAGDSSIQLIEGCS